MGQQGSCVVASCKCSPQPSCHCELDLSRCTGERSECKNFVDQQPLDFSSMCEIGEMPKALVPRCPADEEEVSPLQGNTSATRKLKKEAEEGVTTLDQWLSSEIGDEKLSRTADELLIKALRRAPQKDLNDLRLTTGQDVGLRSLKAVRPSTPSTGRSSQELRSPHNSDASKLGPASAVQDSSKLERHTYHALWENEEQLAPVLPPDAEQIAERTKRNVRFQEGVESRELSQDAEAEPRAERTGDILWHLLPENGPPASQKRRVPKGRRRNDDTASDCSDGSVSSKGSRGSLGSRSSKNSMQKAFGFAPKQV